MPTFTILKTPIAPRVETDGTGPGIRRRASARVLDAVVAKASGDAVIINME